MDYFLFCCQSANFYVKAIYVPYDKLGDNELEEIKKMKEKGEYLKENFNKISHNHWSRDDTFNDIRNILNKWETMADNSPSSYYFLYGTTDFDDNGYEILEQKMPEYHKKAMYYYQYPKDKGKDKYDVYNILKNNKKYEDKYMNVKESIFYLS